ncbi:MAG: hypothetical protein ACOC9D_04585 [Thermodesulfobacteriota bacterium]
MTRIAEYIPNVIGPVFLIILLWIVNKVIQKTAAIALAKTMVSLRAVNLILRFTRYALFVFAFLTVAGQLSINVGSLIAAVGIAGPGPVLCSERHHRQSDFLGGHHQRPAFQGGLLDIHRRLAGLGIQVAAASYHAHDF